MSILDCCAHDEGGSRGRAWSAGAVPGPECPCRGRSSPRGCVRALGRHATAPTHLGRAPALKGGCAPVEVSSVATEAASHRAATALAPLGPHPHQAAVSCPHSHPTGGTPASSRLGHAPMLRGGCAPAGAVSRRAQVVRRRRRMEEEGGRLEFNPNR
jgi:hypothetical protein